MEVRRPFASVAVAVGSVPPAGGGSMVTVGALVYVPPTAVMVTPVSVPAFRVAFSKAPVPFALATLTIGGTLYRLPGAVTLMAVMAPLASTAVTAPTAPDPVALGAAAKLTTSPTA